MSESTNAAAPLLIDQLVRSVRQDARIPLVVLLGTTLERALIDVFAGLGPDTLEKVVVLADQARTGHCPSSLRHILLSGDDLSVTDGCLCCSMRSELASELSRLFFRVLRRQEPSVAAVIIVTAAVDASALQSTLLHAPFLGQRYRLAASLPSQAS